MEILHHQHQLVWLGWDCTPQTYGMCCPTRLHTTDVTLMSFLSGGPGLATQRACPYLCLLNVLIKDKKYSFKVTSVDSLSEAYYQYSHRDNL
jgi:hypothetical protein